MLTGAAREATAASRAAWRGRLPERYSEGAERAFRAHLEPLIAPGTVLLDVGSGRRPAIPVHDRPPGMHYVGLDLSRDELEAAPPGSYDEVLVSDVGVSAPSLVGRFDLALSWQVFEHVRDLRAALENLHAYLKPGGRLSALLSARWSAFAVANSLLPDRLAAPLASRISGRPVETVFPAYYDRCTASQLEEVAGQWARAEIVPAWLGAGYFHFLRPLQAVYVGYEEWARASGRRDLATHYFLHFER